MILRIGDKENTIKVDFVDLVLLFFVTFTSKIEFGGMDLTTEICSFLFIFWLVLSAYDSYFYSEGRD
jgi:hypothetical protein